MMAHAMATRNDDVTNENKPTLEAGIACEAMCAMEEYAIGRMTYVPQMFLGLLEANSASLISPWREAIEDDVARRIAEDGRCDRTRSSNVGPLGMACDAETWRNVLAVIRSTESDKALTPGDRIVLNGNIDDWRCALCSTLRLAPGHGMPDVHLAQAIREIGLGGKWVANALRDFSDEYGDCSSSACELPLSAHAVLDEYDASGAHDDDVLYHPIGMDEKRNADMVRKALELAALRGRHDARRHAVLP